MGPGCLKLAVVAAKVHPSPDQRGAETERDNDVRKNRKESEEKAWARECDSSKVQQKVQPAATRNTPAAIKYVISSHVIKRIRVC